MIPTARPPSGHVSRGAGAACRIWPSPNPAADAPAGAAAILASAGAPAPGLPASGRPHPPRPPRSRAPADGPGEAGASPCRAGTRGQSPLRSEAVFGQGRWCDRRSAGHLHAFGQARPVPGGNAGADRGAPARGRSRLGLRRAGDLLEVPGDAGVRRVPEARRDLAAEALSPWNAVEERYDRVRGLAAGRRLGCQAALMGDVVIDVPPESQVHKQVVSKRAEARADRHGSRRRGSTTSRWRSPTCRSLRATCSGSRRRWPSSGGSPHVKGDLRTLQMLQPALRKGEWKVTCAVYRATGSRGADPARLAGVLRRVDLRAGDRRRLDDHRRAPLRPATGEGGGLHRADEPADPLRRGPDEPGQLRDAEPERGDGDDARGARGAERAGRAGGGGGADRPGADLRGGDRRQPDHAPPAARHRPDRARHGAVRAGHRVEPGALGDGDRAPAASRTRGSTSCRASPAMSGPTPPPWRSRRRRTSRTS